MSSIVFNGSYITTQNTGIGVVSKELLNSLSNQEIITLIPKDIGIRGDICIPDNLSPYIINFQYLQKQVIPIKHRH